MVKTVTYFIESLIMPVGILWLFLLVLTYYGLTKKHWRLGFFSGLMALGLWIVGATPLPVYLLAQLERPYAGVKLADLPPADAIVILGGVLEPSRNDPFGFQINGASDRVLTGVELAKFRKAKVLVIGGGGQERGGKMFLESHQIANWIARWQLSPLPVVPLPRSLNTRDEATHTLELLTKHNHRRVLLVSSAFHLRRATAVFRAAGLDAQPVGCDFMALSQLEDPPAWSVVPSLGRIEMLSLYLHEQIGWLYYQLRGWV